MLPLFQARIGYCTADAYDMYDKKTLVCWSSSSLSLMAAAMNSRAPELREDASTFSGSNDNCSLLLQLAYALRSK